MPTVWQIPVVEIWRESYFLFAIPDRLLAILMRAGPFLSPPLRKIVTEVYHLNANEGDKQMRRLVTAILLAVTLATSGPLRADVPLTQWSHRVLAVDESGITGGVEIFENAFTPSLPFSGTLTATDLDSEATTIFDFVGSGNFASFSFEFGQMRAGAPNSGVISDGIIRFTPTVDVQYQIEGLYEMIGTERIFLSARIRDLSDNDNDIFLSIQESRSTANEQFTLGLEEGDFDNTLLGSTSGTLLAGHDYRFFYDYFIQIPLGGPPPDGGASATGFLNFNITPEPTSAILLGLGGIAMLRKRHRRTRAGG